MKKPMSEALWCDCETDDDRANFIAIGRAYETGIIAKAIQSELVNVFQFRAGIMKANLYKESTNSILNPYGHNHERK